MKEWCSGRGKERSKIAISFLALPFFLFNFPFLHWRKMDAAISAILLIFWCWLTNPRIKRGTKLCITKGSDCFDLRLMCSMVSLLWSAPNVSHLCFFLPFFPHWGQWRRQIASPSAFYQLGKILIFSLFIEESSGAIWKWFNFFLYLIYLIAGV